MTRAECGKLYGGMNLINLTGQRFGRLTVVERAENDKHGSPKWKCVCDCGKEKVVYGSSLRNGKTKSCGCLARELSSNRKKTHGLSKSKLHRVWGNMKDRCENKNCKSFPNYGGRGISVCDEWHNFQNFYDWAVLAGYADGLSLDRIDVNGGYCPDNCRWATSKTQANNQRNNHKIEYEGNTHTISEWAELYGIPKHTLYARIRMGWDIERALLQPVQIHT